MRQYFKLNSSCLYYSWNYYYQRNGSTWDPDETRNLFVSVSTRLYPISKSFFFLSLNVWQLSAWNRSHVMCAVPKEGTIDQRRHGIFDEGFEITWHFHRQTHLLIFSINFWRYTLFSFVVSKEIWHAFDC